jgi:hypothetical protein
MVLREGICVVTVSLISLPDDLRASLTLQDLKILDVGVFGVDIEFDPGHRHIHYILSVSHSMN